VPEQAFGGSIPIEIAVSEGSTPLPQHFVRGFECFYLERESEIFQVLNTLKNFHFSYAALLKVQKPNVTNTWFFLLAPHQFEPPHPLFFEFQNYSYEFYFKRRRSMAACWLLLAERGGGGKVDL